MERYKDQTLNIEERAKALLADMDLEEKMGQVVCCCPQGPEGYDDLLKDYPVGAGHVSTLEMRALGSLKEAAEMQRELQKRIMDRSPHQIPAIFHMEGLCGAYLQGAASFPSGLGRASSWDVELEEKVGIIVGRQERSIGITETLAPVLDISRDSRMGRRGETYGEDPTLAAALGTAYLKGLQREDTDGRYTEGAAKHFLGFHASTGGIHGTDCQIGEQELREIYGKPFQAAITEGGLRGVMPCYCPVNGMPISASRRLLTGLLREEMGFEGVVVSDYCAIMNLHSIQGMFENKEEAGLAAMEAGLDAELQFKYCYGDGLKQMFAEGKADMAVLDQAVLRILKAKLRMGLFEHPFALEGEELQTAFHQGTEEETVLQAARESLVLIKNENHILPLSRQIKKLAVIGCQAKDARIFFGGYTHFSMAEGRLAAISTMAGLQTEKEAEIEMKTIPGTCIQCSDGTEFRELLAHQKPGTVSLLEQLRKSMPDVQVSYAYGYDIAGTDESHHEEALRIAKEADVVLVILGGKHGTSSIASMGEGIDGTDINLPACQERFLEKLGALGKKVVAVHFNGRAISSDMADRYADAILEAWNPAEKGAEAVTDVLLGDYNPSGKLPVSVAYRAAQMPIYYNHPNNSGYHQGGSIAFADYVDCPHRPRYFFGHGLSYTTFEYQGLCLNKRQIEPCEILEISLCIKNTGSRRGTEIVQLYLKDRYASRIRPVMELGGFARVALEPGEEKQILFQVHGSQLAFLDEQMQWKVEAGEINVLVGASSEDIRLTDSFWISRDLVVDGKTRSFWAGSEIVSVDAKKDGIMEGAQI